MLDTYTDIIGLSDRIEDGWIILTPNHRTAVQVQESYGAHLNHQNKNTVRPTPHISPVDIWLKTLANQLFLEQEGLEAKTILDSYQELTLWKKIIRESDISSPLLSLENAAPNILEAYRLITQWQVSLKMLETYQSKIESSEYIDDTSAFLEWAKQYQQYCRREKLINFSELLQEILPYLKADRLELPDKIILFGFSKPPPLYQALFELLENNTLVEHLQWESLRPMVAKQSYADAPSEIKAAAEWSEAILKKSPRAKIGIISNDIHNYHSVFKYIFQSTFNLKTENNSTYFFASTSKFFKEYPLLLEIPKILKFNDEEMSSLELCYLLRSPLLVGQEEENARASLELYLRNKSQMYIRSADLRSLLADVNKDWHSPLLAQALMKSETLRRKQPYSQNLGAWADFFIKQFEILGMDSSRDKEEYKQTLTQENDFLLFCWHQILAEFKQLDFLYHSLTFHQALDILKQLIQNFKYNENRQEAPIQISSSNDAAGLRYTHLWFMGLTDLHWPLSKYTNPFIPIALQKKLNLPESSPKLIHEAAFNILSEFVTNTSDEVILSYPRANANGELTPSPIISLIKTHSEVQQQPLNTPSLQLHPLSLKKYEDATASKSTELLEEKPNIQVTGVDKIKGGINLISDQSDCPFKAFAVHRLKALELSEFTYGIPPKDIGTMLHLVLEQLWASLKNQSAISTLNESELETIIINSCETGIEYLRKKHKYFMHPTYASLEKLRLIKLIRKWLEQENLRSSFEVVAQEFKVQWEHATLKLDFKIDRIDKIENGFALIDYKSGSRKVTVTDEARPSNPQLLLYDSALGQSNQFNPVNALLYAQVNINSPSYHGISLNEDTYPKTDFREQKNISSEYSWEELKQHWQNVLSNIAEEFLEGYLAVEPKGPQICRSCHLSSFCRIQEQHQEFSSAHD